jgi:hypothetical protein
VRLIGSTSGSSRPFETSPSTAQELDGRQRLQRPYRVSHQNAQMYCSALVSRDEMILREPLVEQNLALIRLNFHVLLLPQNGQHMPILS